MICDDLRPARLPLLAAALISAALLASCASIVSDNQTTTLVESDPAGAACTLAGRGFQKTLTTPQSVELPFDAAPVTISCTAEGHDETSTIIETSMDGWILGNVLFGGIIGAVVDATTGAGQKFPSQVKLALFPSNFSSQQSRDDWFDQRRAEVSRRWDRPISGLKARCASGAPGMSCSESDVKKIEQKRDQELAELETRRQHASITP